MSLVGALSWDGQAEVIYFRFCRFLHVVGRSEVRSSIEYLDKALGDMMVRSGCTSTVSLGHRGDSASGV